MGFLANKIKNQVKLDFPYTGVKIISVLEGWETNIKIVDEQYSLHGLIVQTIELYSIQEPQGAEIYMNLLSAYLNISNMFTRLIREDNLELADSEEGLLQKILPTVVGAKITKID